MDTVIKTASIQSEAVMSECNCFRYSLKRIWCEDKPVGAFLCENPSKADHIRSDLTMSNCNNLAVQWVWGGFWLLNLYPGYSTDPSELQVDVDTTRKNDEVIAEVFHKVDVIVLACGMGHKRKLKKVLYEVSREKLFCIGENADGSFLHPSRIRVEKYPRPLKACI